MLEIFQSTLPRGERLALFSISFRCKYISIHAPAWGATTTSVTCVSIELYFNPRSRVGSDTAFQPGIVPPLNFNPRSRVGSDREAVLKKANYKCISIHAPAWGATARSRKIGCCCLNFNPRSRVGSDKNHKTCKGEQRYFNPRSRVGSDGAIEEDAKAKQEISIHAPAWGATVVRMRVSIDCVEFQSTLPRGERQRKDEAAAAIDEFQSTLPRGERRG